MYAYSSEFDFASCPCLFCSVRPGFDDDDEEDDEEEDDDDDEEDDDDAVAAGAGAGVDAFDAFDSFVVVDKELLPPLPPALPPVPSNRGTARFASTFLWSNV